MKKRIVFLLLLSSICAGMHAQNPVSWSFSAQKTGDGLYEVHLTATIEEPWHLYSQTSPAGGALPISFTFNKNPLLTLQGNVKEKGKLISKYEKVFGTELKYFEGGVTFVQTVKMKAKARTTLSGSLEYMVCNDEQCLPPKTMSFTIPVQ